MKRVRREGMWRRLPAILLLLSVIVAGIGVAQAYEAQRSQRETAETILHDYGVFAARSFLQTWTGYMNGAFESTLAAARNAAVRQATTRQCLNTLLLEAGVEDPEDDGICGYRPEPLVGKRSWAFHVTLGAGPSARLHGGTAPAPVVTQAVLDSVVAYVRRSGPATYLQTLRWVDPGQGPVRPMVFHAVQALSTRDTIVYGVEADPAKIHTTLARALDDRALLPEALTNGKRNRELLAVRLVDDDDGEAWRSSTGMEERLEGLQVVPERLGGGVVRASVLPEAAPDLIIGGLPSNRIPLLVLVFAISGLMALMAVVQLRKEERFARERQDFVAGVSHELRTPLAQIRLFSETLKLGRARTEAERRWALANIDRETLRLGRLVDNILHFNRAERGVLDELDREVADLATETRQVVESFTPLLRPREARLVVAVPQGLQAELNRDAFHQVILNLLDNAVKYGPRGQTIRLVGSTTGDTVRLAVEDEGPGVPAEEREAIWAPFRRGTDTVGSVATGSGIGLGVVREIVTALGGHCWVEDGQIGARFVVELPARLSRVGTSEVA